MKESIHTHFGFEEIPVSEKAPRIRGVFDRVAGRYDVMNDVMSGGLHRLWKRAMIDALHLAPGQKLLDVAGGTGDIAFAALKREPSLQVTLSDINPQMLAQGQRRAMDRNILSPPPIPPPLAGGARGGIEWVTANAEALPFPDRSFDRVSIAFGIRNVTHIGQALSEMRRVLIPGGRFACLEFSKPAMPWLDKIYDLYSFRVVPKLGEWIVGDAAPYQYLVESIRLFPAQEHFADMLKAAGFAQVHYRNLSGGIVALHTGVRV